MKKLLYLLLVAILFSCDETSEIEKEISNIPMDVEVVRFDKEFASATPQSLPEIKSKYPMFFPEQFHDSIWLNRVNDTLQQELNQEVLKAFPSEEMIEDQVVPLFQHIKYYFQEFTTPKVLTTTTDVDYQNKAIVADDMLVLSIDTYLGAEHHFYKGIPAYLSKNLKPSQIAPDIAQAYARQLVSPPKDRTLLAQMVYFGKMQYLKELWLPSLPKNEIMGYTEEEMQWAEDNEEYMWRYFIERELLYSTNDKLPNRFIYPAPFSKFYLEIDNESPGRTGVYLGWQMVAAFAEKNDVTLEELLRMDAKSLYLKSNYKPKKKG